MKRQHITREEGKKLLNKPKRKKSVSQRMREKNSKKQTVISRAKAIACSGTSGAASPVKK